MEEDGMYDGERPQPRTVCSYNKVYIELEKKDESKQKLRLPCLSIFDDRGVIYLLAPPPKGRNYANPGGGIIEMWSPRSKAPLDKNKVIEDIGCFVDNVLGIPHKGVVCIKSGRVDVAADAVKEIKKYLKGFRTH